MVSDPGFPDTLTECGVSRVKAAAEIAGKPNP